MGFINELPERLISLFNSPKESKASVGAPPMSTRMDMMSLPEPPNMKDKDYLEAMRGWVYRAVDSIAKEVANIELVLYRKRGKKIEEVEEHPALDVLDRVNDFQSRYDFFYGLEAYQQLVGEAFFYKYRVGGKPRELWILRPDWVKILPPKKDGDFIGGYEYRVPGMRKGDEYKVEDIVHLKSFNPTNPYRGMGPLQAIAYTYDTDLFALKWNRNFFYNNATPSVILKTEQKLKEKEIKRIKSEWRTKFGGVKNAHQLAILTGGLEIDTALKQTLKDMEFLKLREFSRDEIYSIFQVPKTIAAISDDVNRANAITQKEMWMENVIRPRMTKLVGFLNEFYITDWEENLYFGFVDPVPENKEEKLKVVKDGGDVLTINERRDLLGYDPVDEGDVIYMPFSVSPQLGKIKGNKIERKKRIIVNHKRTPLDIVKNRIREEMLKNGTSDILKKIVYLTMKDRIVKEAGKEEVKIPKNKAEAFWKEMVNRSEASEKKMVNILNDYFGRQEKLVLKKVNEIKMPKRIKIVDNYLFDMEEENNILIEVINNLVYRLIAQSGKSALELLDLDEEITFTDRAIETINEFELKLAGNVNLTTYEKLKEQLIAGISNNESVPKITKRVQDVFAEAKTTRSESIARTETIRASNLGNLLGYKQSGIVSHKEWLVALDERTCQYCLAMEKEYKTRTLDENFLNKGDELVGVDGGRMKIDYGDLAVPPLHPNCRCTILPVIKL